MPATDLFGFLFDSSETHHYECRACGTTVRDGVEQCPDCGRDAIAQIRIS